MNKTLIIYDLDGTIIQQRTGSYNIPNGLPYLEVEVPSGKYIKGISIGNQGINMAEDVVVFEDIPKSEVELLNIELETTKELVDGLKKRNATLLLSNAQKEVQITSINTKIANISLELAKIKGGM